MPDDKKEQMAEMDQAAKEARADLEKNLDAWTARDITTWWKKWYLRAGHKRLGRIMVDLSKSLDKSKGG